MTQRIIKIAAFLIISLTFFSSVSAEPRQYVTDELTIPMRSGTTNSHKILKFLKSGTGVLINETTEDGKHSRITLANDNDRQGWVETKHLQNKPVARDRIITINRNIETIRGKNNDLKKELADLNTEYKELNQEKQQLESNKKDLFTSLNRLRKSAAKPIETAEENIRLQKNISDQKKINEKLLRKVAILSDANIKEWFLIGGGVAIGSLIIGLLITRVSWKKKDNWNSSGF